MNNIFKSKYPILEACMNKGSTLQLALALDKVGVYPSLCSWTYNKDFDLMQKELDMYVNKTGNNKIHLSFDLNELPNPDICHKIIDSYKLPTVEIIFVDYVGQKTENIDFKKLKNITKNLQTKTEFYYVVNPFENKISNYYETFEKDFRYIGYYLATKSKVESGSDNRYPVIIPEDNIIHCFTGKIQGIYIIEDFVNKYLSLYD